MQKEAERQLIEPALSPRPLLTYEKLMHRLNVSRRFLAGEVKKGELKPIAIGRTHYFTEEDLGEWLSGRRVRA